MVRTSISTIVTSLPVQQNAMHLRQNAAISLIFREFFIEIPDYSRCRSMAIFRYSESRRCILPMRTGTNSRRAREQGWLVSISRPRLAAWESRGLFVFRRSRRKSLAMSRTLLDCLAERYPTAKRTTLRRMIQAGRVRINDVVAKSANQSVEVSDRLTTDDRPSPKLPTPDRRSDLAIVYEDDDILVANKPAGLLTATNAREKRQTLLALVREHIHARHLRAQVGLIHRLDRDAAGLLVFSKNHQSYLSLKEQFFKHTVHREYSAIVHGVPKEATGRIESRLVERADGTVHATRESGKGELAISHYQGVKAFGNRALVKIILETGKKHQIRVHLSSIGNPIVGDLVYGPRSDSPPLMLAATQLGFVHPRDCRPMKFGIEPPPYFDIKKA